MDAPLPHFVPRGHEQRIQLSLGAPTRSALPGINVVEQDHRRMKARIAPMLWLQVLLERMASASRRGTRTKIIRAVFQVPENSGSLR